MAKQATPKQSTRKKTSSQSNKPGSARRKTDEPDSNETDTGEMSIGEIDAAQPEPMSVSAMMLPPRSWIMVVNPAKGNSWSTLFARGGCTSFWASSDLSELNNGDMVYCYEARPTSAIVATAMVADGLHELDGVDQIVLSRGQMLRRTLPFDVLSRWMDGSSAIARNLRGTLHALDYMEEEQLRHMLRLHWDDHGTSVQDDRDVELMMDSPPVHIFD